MELGDGPFLQIVIGDSQSDKYAHVIIADKRTKNGVRRLVISEFRQYSSLSVLGLMETAVVSGALAYINPIAGLLAFIGKVAFDYGISKQDVSVIVAIKELVRVGILRLNEETMRIEFP